MRLTLGGVRGVGLRVVYGGRGGGGRGGVRGGGAGVFNAAAVNLCLVGRGDTVTAGGAVCSCLGQKHTPHCLSTLCVGCLCVCVLFFLCTSTVDVRAACCVPRAEAGGTGVTVLGLWGADRQAANLAVCAVHHLHKLPTSRRQRKRGLPGQTGTLPPQAESTLLPVRLNKLKY